MSGLGNCLRFCCCGPASQIEGQPPFEGDESVRDRIPASATLCASVEIDPEYTTFKPSGRFTLIFSELWKSHKPVLAAAVVLIIGAVLVNFFVGAITFGTLSIPAAVLSASLGASGSTCIWTSLFRACVAGNLEYKDQQCFINENLSNNEPVMVSDYLRYRADCITKRAMQNGIPSN